MASAVPLTVRADGPSDDYRLFERRIRPVLVEHCYECHSEEAQEQQGGLLLDRKSGWLEGGDSGKAVVPGELESSLLLSAIRYDNPDLQMPPDGKLSDQQIDWFEQWVRGGAAAPDDQTEASEFTRLGDQPYLFAKAEDHWAFQPVEAVTPPPSPDQGWDNHPVDRFVHARLRAEELSPSPTADPRTLIRRLYFDLTGLPPSAAEVESWIAAESADSERATRTLIDRLLQSPSFGQHLGRMWLDVARYADTDSAYRPDTKTPHYFPFAFTYRDYVVRSLNEDKPFDQFVREQLAADLIETNSSDDVLAALGFLTVGPHANRAQAEALDDWIDVTTRGLLGMTVACARCHDHKFEPIPTKDYYALRGVFAALNRIDPLDEQSLPEVDGYHRSKSDLAEYRRLRSVLDQKIAEATGKKTGNNNRSVAQQIRETELAELLLFHPGAPARAMIVKDRGRIPASYVHIRGDASNRGEPVQRRFLEILDQTQTAFGDNGSGRLELAAKITDPNNPLTARVFVNRVWGHLVGSYLVATPSDFGLQGAKPSHPNLLDWLAADFVAHGWSVKHLVRQIVTSRTYQQASSQRAEAAAIDPENQLLWRANRSRLSIESMRDSVLAVCGSIDRQVGGRPQPLWGSEATHRRSIYGFINRFNLDPTLRAFDFPSPMQTHSRRGDSIVAPQALFTMNSPFVIEQAAALVGQPEFLDLRSDRNRIEWIFRKTLQRDPDAAEIERVERFVASQRRIKAVPRFIDSPWPLVAQSLMMSNEFQYID